MHRTATPDEELPVIERVLHPWALTITAPLAELPGWMPRIRRRHPARPLRVLFARGMPGARELPALGFVRVRETVTGTIDPAVADGPRLRAAGEALEGRGLHVEVVPPELLPAWIDAVHARYVAVHRANPPAPLDRAARAAWFAGEDFVPDAAFMVRDAAGIVAHGSLRSAGDGLDVGWFGASTNRGVTARTLDLAVMGEVLRAARRAGAARVYAEYDTSDDQAVVMARDVPVDAPETWETWQTAVPGTGRTTAPALTPSS